MSDLISRQAAIDELKRISFSHWFKCGEYLSEDTREIEIISSSKALEAIEALPSARPEQPKSCNECENFNKTMRLIYSAQPEQRWIPCSERLPEEKDAGILKKLGTEKRSEYVLATVDVKGERMTVTACTYDGKWDWKMKYAFPEHEIVAWMPLPEPYKGKQE